MENFLKQGVEQAAAARELTNSQWADTWREYAVNYALNRQSNEDQLNLWNLMNEYNSPANQMKRFQEAGLNPNLIYSQGTPGNASSAASYSPMTARITPNADTNKQIGVAMDVVGMVNNLAQNIVGLMDSGLNLRLKQNEVEQSDFDKFLLHYSMPEGQTPRYRWLGHGNYFDEVVNPLSQHFDPLQFLFYQKKGVLPQYWNQFLTSESARSFQKFRTDYQQYYNENLLPKFNEYQQGKIDLQEMEKLMQSYEYEVTSMLPPEIRGILEPLVQYISPFLKLIFKRTTINRPK